MVSGKDILQDGSPFIVGGLSIGGLTLLCKYVSVKWGVIVWIAPISLMISSVILYYWGGKSRAENKDTVRDLLWQSIPGMVLLTITLAIWAVSLNHFEFWEAYGIMLAAYAVFATVFFLSVCPSPINGGKCWNVGNIQGTATTPVPKAFAHREGIVFRDKGTVLREQARLDLKQRDELEKDTRLLNKVDKVLDRTEPSSDQDPDQLAQDLQRALDQNPDHRP